MSANLVDLRGSQVKRKHFKPKHQKAKVFRANEPLLSVFMWGVNYTVTGLTHVNVPVMLMPDDFKAFSKVKVDNHHFNKENMPSHFKVKEYCPLVFRNLRERFGIRESDYVNSLTKSQPMPVDSGRNKLYESFDKMFIVKGLLSEEVEFMHTLLKQYHPYIVEKHGRTLLPKYLGLYRLSVEGNETYLVVMKNVFCYEFTIHSKYHLKGTTTEREASIKEKTKELPTLKDGDFFQEGCKLYFGPEKKKSLLGILSEDVQFLAGLHLLEYWICLGIHDCHIAQEEAEDSELSEDSNTAAPGSPQLIVPTFDLIPKDNVYVNLSCEDSPRQEIYFMAIDDVLQHYGTRKRTITAGSLTPEQYAHRLLDFMSEASL